MAAHKNAIRVPAPAERPPGMSMDRWYAVRKRGWWCPGYMDGGIRVPTVKDRSPGPERRVCYDGPDYFSQTIHDPERFFGAILQRTLRRNRLTWSYFQKCHPWIEREDLIHEAIVRALELRSDPKGENNPLFFAKVGATVQSNFIRSLWRRLETSSIEEEKLEL